MSCNSILTLILTPIFSINPTGFRAQSSRRLHSLQTPAPSLRGHLPFWRPVINLGFLWPLPIQEFPRMTHWTHQKHYTHHCGFIIKDTDQEWPNERHTWGKVKGRGHGVSLCSLLMESQHIIMLTNQEAPPILGPELLLGFLSWAWLIKSLAIWLNSISSIPAFTRSQAS